MVIVLGIGGNTDLVVVRRRRDGWEFEKVPCIVGDVIDRIDAADGGFRTAVGLSSRYNGFCLVAVATMVGGLEVKSKHDDVRT